MADYGLETKVWNKRQEPAQLYDSDGRMIRQLIPGEILTIESSTDKTLIAPYSEIVFEKDGSVALTKRDGWVDPYLKDLPWRVEIINQDGRDIEERYIGGRVVSIPKHFPVIVFVDSSDPWAGVEKLIIEKTKERQKVPQWNGYLAWVPVLKDTRVYRSQKELDEIEKDRKGPDTTQVPSDTK